MPRPGLALVLLGLLAGCASAPDGTVVESLGSPPVVVERPEWKVGDQWTFRWWTGIDRGTFTTVVAPFLAKQKFTFPVALDPRGEVGKQFGARALPTTSILGPDGALAAFAYGPRRWDGKASLDLLDALRARSP